MRSPLNAFVCLFLSFCTLSCSVNILENFANKNSNEALFVQARTLINEGDYAGALEKFALMTGEYTSERKVIVLKASAHAGLCGLTALPLIEALGGLSSTRLFPLLLSHFRNGNDYTKVTSCITAENLLESIGTKTERTNDENLDLVLVSLAKIGQILSYYADSNQDGTVTASYDVCTAGGGIPDTDARELGTGITIAMESLTQIGSSVNLGLESLTDITEACNDLTTAGGGTYNFCGVIDPTVFTAQHLLAIRSLFKEDSTVGLDPLGGACNGDVTACRCF